MSRKSREFSPDLPYHVITRGNNRSVLFRCAQDFEKYLWLIAHLKTQYQFELFHYCLMTNHVHLLMRFPDRETFQKVPQRLNLNYARYVAWTYKTTGHVFQDRFRSLPVRDNRYFLECGRYIERNPVNAGMVERAVDYPWSSHRFYALGEKNALLTSNPMFLDLAADERRTMIYRDLVDIERPYEEATMFNLFGRKWQVAMKVSHSEPVRSEETVLTGRGV
jgi:putative transposase